MATRDTTTRTYPLGNLKVTLNKPSEGQLLGLRRVQTLLTSNDKASIARAGVMFLDMLDSLVTDSATLDAVYGGLMRNEIDMADYAGLAVLLLQEEKAELDKRRAAEESQAGRAKAATRRPRAR